ncbi:hypothetical protein HanPSC8_Chr16g0719771 [Helianthus annuus]|nr:hypothetical protein HanIR_Chr16g0816051 [Helianthus annuus]KAJ0641050.1 hypothetical protein HanLR1_Chr16g0622741 [Helianthus annuus]KAJ0821402.1 hypothetical protein HanPSC8_Chr16g0719771 [Helianthus annuus]
MSHTCRSTIRFVLTTRDLESFVETYRIPERFSPTLPGPDDSAECTPDRIVLYTLSFSSCGVRYPLSAFKVDLLRHFRVHFSQLHPLGFMRVVHFELSCVAVSEMTLWGLLQGDCKDVKFMVGDKIEPSMSRGVEKKATEGSVQAGDSAAEEKDEEVSSGEKKGPLGSLQVRSSSDDDNDKDLESRLIRKQKVAPPSSPKQVLVPRDIRLRLRSASGQKAFPATRAASELPPTGVKGSLSKHLRSSSLLSEPLLGSSNAPIEIPTALSSSRVRDKTPEVSAARITPAFEVSPLHATGTSKPSRLEGFVSRSPLTPLFADALPIPYIPRWKITQSSVVGTPETARDFLAHVVPPSHRFMNSALTADLFDDQYSMSLCEGFFRGIGMLQRVDELRRENEGLRSDLQTSQTVAAEFRCQVVDVERKLQEEKGAGAMLEQKERAWAREMAALVEEKEELAAELKH